MVQTLTAIYEQGVLRPMAPLTGVTEGQEVLLTVQSKPTGAGDSKEKEEAFRHYMEAQGLLVKLPPPAEPPPKDFKPIVIVGEPLSETILRERR